MSDPKNLLWACAGNPVPSRNGNAKPRIDIALTEPVRRALTAAEGEFQSVLAGAESFPENASACGGLNDCVEAGLDVATDAEGLIYVLDLVVGDIRVMRRKVAGE